MQSLRIGSIVTVQYLTPNGSGGYNLSVESGRLVTNMTDSYIEYESASDGSGKTALPWGALLKALITTV